MVNLQREIYENMTRYIELCDVCGELVETLYYDEETDNAVCIDCA